MELILAATSMVCAVALFGVMVIRKSRQLQVMKDALDSLEREATKSRSEIWRLQRHVNSLQQKIIQSGSRAALEILIDTYLCEKGVNGPPPSDIGERADVELMSDDTFQQAVSLLVGFVLQHGFDRAALDKLMAETITIDHKRETSREVEAHESRAEWPSKSSSDRHAGPNEEIVTVVSRYAEPGHYRVSADLQLLTRLVQENALGNSGNPNVT
jgi:hypothetical protein